jgi:hypothetical protein
MRDVVERIMARNRVSSEKFGNVGIQIFIIVCVGLNGVE